MKEKDFNAMLNNSKDMPIVKTIANSKVVKRYGGDKMLIAAPLNYDELMKKVPFGKIITSNTLRVKLASKYHADFTCPLTAGIFINIVAWASHTRNNNITPYWRTLKAGGELNEKYPGGITSQIEKLEAEGHHIITKGSKNVKYYVENYEQVMFEFKE